MSSQGFSVLNSDAVLLQAAAASDVKSLWRRLARTPEVASVALMLASDPESIRRLCRWIQTLLRTPYDSRYRHPAESAICAGLVLLEQSPLPEARALFAQLCRERLNSLVWIRRMAEYCSDRFIDSNSPSYYQPVKPPALHCTQYQDTGASVTLAGATCHTTMVA